MKSQTRRILFTALGLLGCSLNCIDARAATRGLIQVRVQQESAGLLDLYKYLHTHPELSFNEEQTAARVAEELRKAGYDVTTKVGKHGVVGILRNGAGPTVLVRT